MTREFRYPQVAPVPPKTGTPPQSQRALVEASLLKCPPKTQPQKRA